MDIVNIGYLRTGKTRYQFIIALHDSVKKKHNVAMWCRTKESAKQIYNNMKKMSLTDEQTKLIISQHIGELKYDDINLTFTTKNGYVKYGITEDFKESDE